ncbi:MAG: hypothetical protein WCW63_02040 [Acholeplasmataceae bacterium]|jgi:hypothetical protein
MKKIKSVQTKRDIFLSVALFIVVGALFLLFRLTAFNSDATQAYIFYGDLSNPIVTIDFAYNNGEGRIVKNYDQEVPNNYGNYPIINENDQTITLLGDYEIDGVRQIVVIKYDYIKKSVQIIEEQSPNNICSREGESTGWPLICLPNRIRVEFDTNEEDFTI